MYKVTKNSIPYLKKKKTACGYESMKLILFVLSH